MGATGVPCLPSCLGIICPKGDTDLKKKDREKLYIFFDRLNHEPLLLDSPVQIK